MSLPRRKEYQAVSRREFLGIGSKVIAGIGFAGVIPGCELIPDPESSTRIEVPKGFVPRIVARSGFTSTVNSDYPWHASPDGGACFAAEEGEWIYVSNCESSSNGGVGALRFDTNGEVIDSYSILYGSRKNCSGGATPWDTWLSCEEESDGRVWECDPFDIRPARALNSLGRFAHESACVDPLTWQIYLTEDKEDGCLYRFTPSDAITNGAPDLRSGKLEVARITDGFVSWVQIPDPQGRSEPLRYQVKGCARFRGGEGIDIHDRFVRFTTKIDNRVWQLNLLDDSIRVLLRLSGQVDDVDDITHTASGEILVAEDGRLMRVIYFANNSSKPVTLLRLPEHTSSEITGLAFDPSGSRLYFSSQRGNTGEGKNGISLELSGDFSSLAAGIELVEWNLEHPGGVD